MVVMLHGCTQTPAELSGDRWNSLADQQAFVVVYPEQTFEDHPLWCWDWFLPEHQVRGSGEVGVRQGQAAFDAMNRHGRPVPSISFHCTADGVVNGNQPTRLEVIPARTSHIPPRWATAKPWIAAVTPCRHETKTVAAGCRSNGASPT